MRKVSAKFWVAGASFASVLVLVAAWFLLIDPVVARAAQDTAQAEQERQQNDLLELEITKLESQFAELPIYKAQLEALRYQLPPQSDPAGITRELEQMASAAGVVLVAVQPSTPQLSVVAQPATATSDSAAEDEEGSDETAAAEQVTTTGDFYEIPLTIGTVGSYDSSVAFLRMLQEESVRLYLASSIQATTLDDGGASGGRPATANGDIELTITGATYVLGDASVPAPEAPTTVPVPGGEANPFQPGR